MKSFDNGDFLKAPLFMKILGFVLISIGCFYLGKHWSDGYQQLVFFNNPFFTSDERTLSIAISPNANKEFDLSFLIANQTDKVPDGTIPLISTSSPERSPAYFPPPPPPASLERLGIVDENGTMAVEFEIGGFDPDMLENWGNDKETKESQSDGTGVRVKRFALCPANMRDYIPCLDNVDEIKKLKTTERGERFERYCPGEGRNLNCLVPAPKDYNTPIPWPSSRDEVFPMPVLLFYCLS